MIAELHAARVEFGGINHLNHFNPWENHIAKERVINENSSNKHFLSNWDSLTKRLPCSLNDLKKLSENFKAFNPYRSVDAFQSESFETSLMIELQSKQAENLRILDFKALAEWLGKISGDQRVLMRNIYIKSIGFVGGI